MVEKLLNTCLVPFTLPTEERMKKLYYLLGTVDENATKAFIELQKLQLSYVIEIVAGNLILKKF